MNAPSRTPLVEDTTAPTRAQIKAAHELVRDEILMGRNVVRTKFHRLEDAVTGLVDAFIDGRYAEIKQASEVVRAVSHDIAATAEQIEGLAGSLVKTTCAHLNRKPRP